MIFKKDDKGRPLKDRSDRPFSSLLNASAIGMVFVTSIFIGTGMGFFLDRYFNTKPYLTIFLMLMGIIAGFKNAYEMIKKTGILSENKDDKSKDDNNNNGDKSD